MSDAAVAGLVVALVGVGAMSLVCWLSSKETRAAMRGETKVQDRSKVRLGLFYADADDPRVWVPRPMGNGWDPNLATWGGKAVWGGLGALLLATAVLGVVAAVHG